jgi:hypothetical protein
MGGAAAASRVMGSAFLPCVLKPCSRHSIRSWCLTIWLLLRVRKSERGIEVKILTMLHQWGDSEKRLVAVWCTVSLHHKRIRSVLQLGLMWWWNSPR